MTPDPSPTPARRGAKALAAASRVRSQILTHRLAPGDVVRPEEIGQQLGISQTPAREALQALKTEGFLHTVAGLGFVVAPLTGDDLLDIFTAHAFLSGELAARAAGQMSENAVDELEAVHYDLLAALRRGQLDAAEKHNHTFHRMITEEAQSPKLAQILAIVTHYVPRDIYASIEGWGPASADDHDAIVSAIRRRDGDAARLAMSSHMHHAGELIAAHFDAGREAAGGS